MSLKAYFVKKTFKFRFDAGTSRGILREKNSFFVIITDAEQAKTIGIGEAAPLKGLSTDDIPDFENRLEYIIHNFNLLDVQLYDWNINIIINQLITNDLPSIKFAFETALWDYLNGGTRVIFNNDFSKRRSQVAINGLVWMGTEHFMREQIAEKLAAGFKTIKMKIGAIDFDTEYKLLRSIRETYASDIITLRVDANGGYSPTEVREILKALKKIEVHSIEQPIQAGQPDEMARLCEENIVPIALDEELIGVTNYVQKRNLLKNILPQYIIIKPTLIGGIQDSKEWIDAARQFNINWWMTSALESNIGLNAISQFAAEYLPNVPHGLGTGQLYVENIPSPLKVQDGFISLISTEDWDLNGLITPLLAE